MYFLCGPILSQLHLCITRGDKLFWNHEANVVGMFMLWLDWSAFSSTGHRGRPPYWFGSAHRLGFVIRFALEVSSSHPHGDFLPVICLRAMLENCFIPAVLCVWFVVFAVAWLFSKSRSSSCTSFPYMVRLDTVAKGCGVLMTIDFQSYRRTIDECWNMSLWRFTITTHFVTKHTHTVASNDLFIFEDTWLLNDTWIQKKKE